VFHVFIWLLNRLGVDTEIHMASELPVGDLSVRMRNNRHEPNGAEKQRPERIPVNPEHRSCSRNEHQLGTPQAGPRPMTKGRYRGFDPDYLCKTRFDGGRAAIKQLPADYFRGFLDHGIDFSAPFVGRGLSDVEINAVVFHYWREPCREHQTSIVRFRSAMIRVRIRLDHLRRHRWIIESAKGVCHLPIRAAGRFGPMPRVRCGRARKCLS
jgi:hypothetical protein